MIGGLLRKPIAMKALILLIVATPLFIQCTSIDKMIDSGSYDEAFSKAHRKINGKSQPKEKHLLALREAYLKAVNRDLNQISRLKRSATSADWERILNLYQKLERRQDALQALIPHQINDWPGDLVEITDFEVDQMSAEENLVRALYEESNDLLEEARFGNRDAARKAHHRLNRILELRHSFKDTRELKAESRALGMTNVGLFAQNQSDYPISDDILAELILANTASNWIAFHVKPEESREMDYEVVAEIDHIWTSPERIHETITEEFREIEDGWEYVLDENGNVKKDSVGNDIKQTRLTTVRAKVIHTELFKEAYVEGTIRCKNLSTHIVDYVPLRAELIFSDLAARFIGNRRALSTKTKKLIEKPLAAFPTDEQMIADVMKEFQRNLREKMYREDLYASL